MKNTLYLFSFLLVFTLFQQTKAQQRVVGGADAKLESSPYTVSFQGPRGNHVCGGAIISKNCIISAAHCFIQANLEYVIAVVGTVSLTRGGDEYNISKVIIHSNYSVETKENDIALVFTSKKIKFSKYVSSVSFLARYIDTGELVTFTGFGASANNGNASETLQTINLTVFNMDTCKYAYRNIRPLFDSQLCTFNGKDQGTCHGDSGAPLVYKSSLIGIASFGIPCAIGFPDVFTRVSAYVPWVKQYAPDL